MCGRCSLMGFDLNRVWQDPSPWAHPELYAAKAQVLESNKDPVWNALAVYFWLNLCSMRFIRSRLSIWTFSLTSTPIRRWWMDSCTAISTTIQVDMKDKPYFRNFCARMPMTFQSITRRSTETQWKQERVEGAQIDVFKAFKATISLFYPYFKNLGWKPRWKLPLLHAWSLFFFLSSSRFQLTDSLHGRRM